MNHLEKITTMIRSFREKLKLIDIINSQFVQKDHRTPKVEIVTVEFILIFSKIKKKAKEVKM